MNGEYLRVTGAELRLALEDPDWAYEFANSWREAIDFADDAGAEWDGRDPAEARQRFLTTHKAWEVIAFLLRRASFPIDVVMGEHTLGDDSDWGYGPARYLTAQEVAQAAAGLAALPFSALADGVALADLAAASVYPMIWDEPEALQWVQHWYEPLPTFLAAAAHAGDSVLVWLD
ncbi:YfbM family protein [Rhizocola hellebori]|nr:YfbM family protein [Rhizocola hellebori]